MKAPLLVLFGALLAAGPACAQLKPAALAYSKGDLPQAIQKLQPLAQAGDPIAQRLLGTALANVKPPLLNLAEGEGWLKKSAAQGQVAAMRDLGQLNLFAKHPPERAEAERWLLAAAQRGDSESQHLLGLFYLDGKDADRKGEQAYRWLTLASERGHLLSSVMLAETYFSEREREEGRRLAAEWRPER